ncbi:MAG: GntR family transcriptional regulator [Ruminococcaceae bacterium]|nr:GntR family transcriptional regulator [Oscillospiraceae bacterium]
MEHKNLSLADQVFERLEGEILSGKYPRGAVLTELALCTDMGVSRTPIREAAHRLAQEHLVELTTKGITVLGVTEKDLSDIYDIRMRLEGMAAALAAKNATEQQIKEMKDALDLQEFYEGKKDPEHIRYMDSRFHDMLYAAANSIVLYDTLMPLHKKTQKFRKASVENHSRAAASLAEHRVILQAIAAHDEIAAEKAMSEHVKNAKKHITKGQ